MTVDEAVLHLRSRPEYAELVHHAYLGEDLFEAAERFERSGEFEEVCATLGPLLSGARVLDVGAGSGIASWAFLRRGAARVHALEPDPSELAGRGALKRLLEGCDAEILAAAGEDIPLPDDAVDVVYARQVLHHTRDLAQTLRECARVLRPGGTFIACREHVVDNERDLEIFLAGHPMQPLTGAEHAFPLESYRSAIEEAGLTPMEILGPWDSVINAYPLVRSRSELRSLPRTLLERRFGRLATPLARSRWVVNRIWRRLDRPTPGRLYTFVARKPQER